MNFTIERGGVSLASAVRRLYERGQADYSLDPLVLVGQDGQPVGRIQNGDSVVFCCRRGERQVQLTEAFVEKDFPHFARPDFHDLNFVILTLYHEKFKDIPVAFLPTRLQDTLGETVSRAGLRQLRVSESEKFAHITFFLNGGSQDTLAGEEDCRIPTIRGIPYEQVPELSLPEVARRVMEGIDQKYDLIITNFANGDMIGHTTDCQAKIRCAQAVDHWLEQVVQKAFDAGTVVLITADHGNLEEMLHADGTPHVSHTANPVPFILIDPGSSTPVQLRTGGSLGDVAPTILHAMGIAQPSLMSGHTLMPGCDWHAARRVLLIILDGWGIGEPGEPNPIYLAPTPVWDSLLDRYPHTCLDASGEAVGLQAGKPGNSEAGHMNIGAGRTVLQDDVRLEQAMKDGSYNSNEILCNAIHLARQKGKALHLLSLLSEKSSHGSIDYPLALLRMSKNAGLDRVYLHIIFDGRSTEPGSAPALLEKLDRQMQEIGTGQVVSGVGRGIALDRDGNYAKIQKAFDAFVFGRGERYQSI